MKFVTKIILASLLFFASTTSYAIDLIGTHYAPISEITYGTDGAILLRAQEGWFPAGNTCEFKQSIRLQPSGIDAENLASFEVMSSLVIMAYQQGTPVRFIAVGVHENGECAAGTGSTLDVDLIRIGEIL